MSEMKTYNPAEAEALDSREVAGMVEKRHDHLMRDIKGYIADMEKSNAPKIGVVKESKIGPVNERKIAPVDFFIPSTYTDSKGESRPCYLITKKGCEFVANKLTGEKGTKFTAMYVTRFNIMEEREKQGLTGKPQKSVKSEAEKRALAEAKLNNSRARMAAEWRKLAGMVSIPTYKDICASHASAVLAGKEVLPLPDREERYYTATEVGEMLGGVSKTKIGTLANQNGLKTEQYGRTIWDKSPYSSKEVQSFVYNEAAVERFRELLGLAERHAPTGGGGS